MSLIDRNFLVECCLTAKISSMTSLMKIKGMLDITYEARDFAVINIFLPSDHNIITYIRRELHILVSISAKILLGIDILSPEGWYFNIETETMTLPYCVGITIHIVTKEYLPPLTPVQVFSHSQTVIQPHSQSFLRVASKSGSLLIIPPRNFICRPNKSNPFTSYQHIVSNKLNKILVESKLSNQVNVPATFFHGIILDIDIDGILRLESDVFHLAAVPSTNSTPRAIFKYSLAAAAASPRNTNLTLTNE